jgi:hypothetical protein
VSVAGDKSSSISAQRRRVDRQCGRQRRCARSARPEDRLGELPVFGADFLVGQRMFRSAARLRRLGDERAAVGELRYGPAPSARPESGARIRRLRSARTSRAAARPRIAEAVAADLGGADSSENQRRRHRKGRLYCASSVVAGIRHCEPRSIASRKLSTPIATMSSPSKRCASLSDERRLDRRLRPAADRIRLEILLADAPALAQVAPQRLHLVRLDVSAPARR